MTWDIRWVDETGSTNADVLEAARGGAPEGLVVVADHQTAGRGRRGRSWESPPGATLMFTVLLRPPEEVAAMVTMALGVAAVGAVVDLTGVAPRLKWPNDLVWPGTGAGDDRKLAGILAEADWADPGGPAVAVGMGLNVDWRGPMPGDLATTAVALDELTGPASPPERRELLDAILARLGPGYRTLVDDPRGASELRIAWSGASGTLGRRVRVDLGTEIVEGEAAGIVGPGHLVVRPDAGAERVLTAGDVVHLRPG